MAETKTSTDNLHTKNGNFICGVVEGFYGRPWTTEQRKDLFQKLKKWGMDSYLYAPKDDYKHRAYWRELYTVEEAEHLTSLILSAKEHGITFYYAISPGLDITYSSAKEVTALKRKLEQVSQFGCTAFALLFDDIEPEMSEADKEVFQSFGHAQVSVTNEMYQHLGQPTFLLCPTQYCAARATPNVANSEYLNTLGAKLPQEIDIMWTGPKVISRTLTVESIEEITEVLRRPPVIWDNLHANDYDQKRVFLGPYSGRSPDLIPKLRGVLTNPNCEYGANFIAIHTLAQWSRCNIDAIRDPSLNDTVSADIKLETEGVSEEGPCCLSPNMYHPRRALRNAINEWLPEFKKFKAAWGPIAKPQPVIAAPVPIPIIPSVNTCMSLTATTMTTNSVASPIPVGNANQLQALAEVCSSVQTNDSLVQPTSASAMNSLASETKVVPLATVKNGKTGNQEPMDCNPTPGGSPGSPSQGAAQAPDILMADSSLAVDPNGSTMQVESLSDENISSSTTQMAVDGSSNTSLNEDNSETPETNSKSDKDLTVADLALLCDLFYLPFEHGGAGIQLLQEFHWLKTNAHVLAASSKANADKEVASTKPEVEEWFERAKKFEEATKSVNTLFQRLTFCANRELLYDLYPYMWDVRGVVSLLNSYVKWLAGGHFPALVSTYTLGQYTWFSKGWKEAFMSGEQEPWVFRGGLTADLQRLLPVDSGTDLFLYKAPEVPSSKIYTVRPYLPTDKDQLYRVCVKTSSVVDIPEAYAQLPGDRLVGGYLELASELCVVVEDETEIVGFAVAALDSRQFFKKLQQTYFSEMKEKYPLPPGDVDVKIKELIEYFHNSSAQLSELVHNQYPSVMTCEVLASIPDQSVSKRLLACLLAALRANGSFGVYVSMDSKDRNVFDFYSKLGFVEITGQAGVDKSSRVTYMGIDDLKWAYEFLKSIKNQKGENPPDVKVCLKEIQDRLINLYAKLTSFKSEDFEAIDNAFGEKIVEGSTSSYLTSSYFSNDVESKFDDLSLSSKNQMSLASRNSSRDRLKDILKEAKERELSPSEEFPLLGEDSDQCEGAETGDDEEVEKYVLSLFEHEKKEEALQAKTSAKSLIPTPRKAAPQAAPEVVTRKDATYSVTKKEKKTSKKVHCIAQMRSLQFQKSMKVKHTTGEQAAAYSKVKAEILTINPDTSKEGVMKFVKEWRSEKLNELHTEHKKLSSFEEYMKNLNKELKPAFEMNSQLSLNDVSPVKRLRPRRTSPEKKPKTPLSRNKN